MAYTIKEKQEFLQRVLEFIDGDTFNRNEAQLAIIKGQAFPRWIYKGKVGHNLFSILEITKSFSNKTKAKAKANPTSCQKDSDPVLDTITDIISESESIPVPSIKAQREELIPEKDPLYVRTKSSSEIQSILDATDSFLPVYVHGASGTGKTYMIMQESAKRGLPVIRMNITEATCDDDLIGGFRLRDGDTVWQDGPVIRAMKLGTILILDELDRASSLILALQPVLEGKPVHIAKVGVTVEPAPGFKIFATANSNGRGESTSSRYVSARVQDDATLERFPVFIQSTWMTCAEEAKVYMQLVKTKGMKLDENLGLFIKDLSVLVTNIRELYDASSIGDVISTRRGVHIMELYPIFGPRKAIELATNRFELETQESILQTYDIIGESHEIYSK